MGIAYKDLTVQQGSTYTETMNLGGFNLAGFSVVGQAKKSYINPAETFSFVTTIDDYLNGVISLYIDANTTANLTVGKMVYDIDLYENSTGYITTIMQGQLLITPGVTNFAGFVPPPSTPPTDLGLVTDPVTNYFNLGNPTPGAPI